MKNRLLASLGLALTFFCLLLGTTFAQGSLTQGTAVLNFSIQDNQGKPMVGTEIEFVEIQTRQRVLAKTNAEGKVEQAFNTGRFWQINVLQIRDYFFWQFEVAPGRNMRLNKTITYDFKRYERETRPAVDRSKLGLKTEAQKVAVDAASEPANAIVKLEIKRANDQPLLNYPVAITCYKLRKTFTTTTNAAGIATFKVPIDNEYEIDIDGIPSFDYIDLPNKPGYHATRRFTFEPTIIKEKIVRDTVEQMLAADQEGTSGSVITNITLKGGPDGVWRNEPVFLEVLGDKKTYRGKTDQNGNVRFLLPKGKKYMIHGRFEFDLDVVDLTRRRGIGYSNKAVRYVPQEKYLHPDKFIPKPEELVVDAFAKFMEDQFARPENDNAVNTIAKWGGPVNASSKEAVLQLSWVPGGDVDKKASPPINIALVIDKSGSMAGHDRIDQLKLSLIDFVSALRKVDIVSLVIFEDFETVLIPSQPIGENKTQIIQLIERIEADGGTNIFKGLQAGYREVQKNYKAGSTNRVILLTDGYDGTPIEDFITMQNPYTVKGLECSAVGVGEGYNMALLKQLATLGGGLLEHVGDARSMQEAFVNQLNSVLFPVAKDLEVEILYNKHLEFKQLMGYPLSERSGNRLKLKLKNMYLGLNQLAYIQFKLIKPDASIEQEPVIVNLKYTDLRTGKLVQQTVEAPLQWAEGNGELELQLAQNEKKTYAVAVLNASLKAMSDKFHGGDLPGAKAALQEGLAFLQKTFPTSQDADLKDLKFALENYLDVLVKQK